MSGTIIPLNSSRSSRNRYYLLHDGKGMGGYGKPAHHYLNQWVVANGADRGNGYQGYSSVDYATGPGSSLPDDAKVMLAKLMHMFGWN